jgi:hypothetical protein
LIDFDTPKRIINKTANKSKLPINVSSPRCKAFLAVDMMPSSLVMGFAGAFEDTK